MTDSEPDDFKVSPMMAQWHACKKQAKDAVLFFRMGDFYEAFYEDAALLSRELELTLTKRQGIPMSGVPHHTCESYIDKLVGKGFRVAIAEQTEDPQKTKGLVKRELVKIVTPGTTISSSLVPDKANNYFAAINQVGAIFGLAVVDLTTGEFRVVEFTELHELINELHRLMPSELLISEHFQNKNQSILNNLRQSYAPLINEQEDWRFDHRFACDFLIAHFRVHSLDGFGLKGMVAGINAAGALLAYLKETLCHSISHIQEVETYSTSHFMILDPTTIRNLELTESLRDGSRKNTLLEVLDKTCTAMGGRLLRQWIKLPLISTEEISMRQGAIETLLYHPQAMEKLSSTLSNVRDLERLMMKISAAYASPRDLIALCTSLEMMPEMHVVLKNLNNDLLTVITTHVIPFPEVTERIRKAIVDEPPARLSDGKVFKQGFHQELDELRQISQNGKQWLASYQNQLREQTGIKTLKVGFNRMFGYYIEVSRGQSEKMPSSFQRKQTLVNAERYVTAELKEYEHKVLTAEDRMMAIESELFQILRHEITTFSSKIIKLAQHLARLDCLLSLAEVAKAYGYQRPLVDNSKVLHILEGRHPVIEASLMTERFIPNDTVLDHEDNRMLIITGPNMAGKSTYIRQVALLTIMAQIGSYVPVKAAHIGIVDKVFTRIGASDDLARGQSTFMVEMSETANILHHATHKSLVILDEIGRGTSTYDGISIAWAVAEYLLNVENKNAKTLFATHYWELTKLEGKHKGAVNYNVAVQEFDDHIVFLRKIIKGGTDRSYGIHVARLAGMPSWVIGRAKEILEHLEVNANRKSAFEPEKPKKLPPMKQRHHPSDFQLFLFSAQPNAHHEKVETEKENSE